ncbi:MAG: TetR/AcrR family transcriptional regulator, partial [Anaerolineae bacterium]|nr:TetR/AcrR family transcriptional regulator [Anaerolineae bacterium]
DHLVDQITHILVAGVAEGAFIVSDPASAARAVFHATTRFHDPVHAKEWNEPGIDAAFEDVWALVMRGLGAGGPTP